MPEEVFKWMAHTVNQDFLSLGYPAILTKSDDQEFVNLCPLIRNCSSVLTLVKAQKRTLNEDNHASFAIHSSTIASTDSRSFSTVPDGSEAAAKVAAAAGETASSASITGRHKRRRWGLFSSKQHRRPGSGRHQQQQLLQQPPLQSSASANLHENMVRKMRKDTERIIRRTGCFSPSETAAAAAACPPTPYPEGTQDHQDFVFMHTTWHNFRHLAQARIAECAEAQRRVDALQRDIAALSLQLERTRSAAIAVSHAEDPTSPTMAAATGGGCGSSTSGSVGRLQRVGGFLRRAVSKERLTFGRRSKLSETDEAASSSGVSGCGVPKRSRSCSLSAGLPAPASVAADPETELRRIRIEFDRRERLLLCERDKLRQANSKLNFRVQHLSGLVAAAKQNTSNGSGGGGGGSSGGGGCGTGVSGGKEIDYQYRRIERRAATLQKEVSALKQELNERIDSLSGIGAAVAKFSCDIAEAAGDGSDNSASLIDESPTDPARVPQLVDSICRATLARLCRLRQSLVDAQAKAASAGDCLQLVQQRLGLTKGAMENTRAMEVELDAIATRLSSKVAPALGRSMSVASSRRRPPTDVERALAAAVAVPSPPASALGEGHQRLELRDRIIDKLTAMLRERQEEVRRLKEFSVSCQDISGATLSTAGAASAGGGMLQYQQERRSRPADTRSNALR